jgi:mRNA-degrading endonuclease RelE of RelBE toxin-antitoxin system
MAEPYEVELTATAEEIYSRIFNEAQECIKAGDRSNSKVVLLKQVDEVIDKIIPHDPVNPQRGLRGPLSNIFRISKGRMRICYVASSKERKIVILYISDTPRKAGDVNDPYSVFTRLVLSGKFDDIFTKLGVRRPPRQGSGASLQPLVQ